MQFILFSSVIHIDKKWVPMIIYNSWFLLLLYFNSISSCTRLSSFKVHLSLPQFVHSLISVLSKIKFRIKIKIEIFFRYWSFVRIIFLQLFSSPSKTIPSNFEPNLGSVRRWKMAFQDKDRFQTNGFQNNKGKLNNLDGALFERSNMSQSFCCFRNWLPLF